MADLDLCVPAAHISAFIDQAQRVLASRRAKTAFGKQESTHWIHTGCSIDQSVHPLMVVLSVRSRATKKGDHDVRVFLTAVRPLEANELIEGGYADQARWPDGFAAEAWQAVARLLREAATAVMAPPSATEFRRGYLAFNGTRMSGEYRAGGWRLARPHFPEDPGKPASLFGEQMVACDRDVGGRDSHDISLTFMSELEQLALLLTVFWRTRVYTTHHGEHRWVYEGIVDGEMITRLRQIGFSEPTAVLPRSMPPPGALPPGPTRRLDRLNPDHYPAQSGGFTPPEDAAYLLELFNRASRTDPIVTERFLAAAKAYQTSSFIGRATATGSLSYLVVAAESLVEEELPTCGECNQKRGALGAMRDLIFQELPCLREREPEVRRLLRDAYETRSRHFHAGQFAGGELEPWRNSNILEPANQALRTVVQRMNAIVNALLIAWLVNRVTGTPWPRASEAMPEWRDHQMFSITVSMGS